MPYNHRTTEAEWRAFARPRLSELHSLWVALAILIVGLAALALTPASGIEPGHTSTERTTLP